MPRKRMIYPETWRSRQIVRVSRDARLLFIGMITLADDYGYGDADATGLRVSIFPADNDISDTVVERLRDELVSESLIEVNGDIYKLPRWADHQKLRSDYTLDGKYKSRWHGPVTDPLRTRHGTYPQVSKQVSKKDKRSTDAKKPRRPNLEFDTVEAALIEKTGKKPTPATVQKVLSLCKERDLNPLPLMKKWTLDISPTPFGMIVSACRDPDGYADSVGGWGKFIEGVYGSDGPRKSGKDSGPQSIGDILDGVMPIELEI